MSIHMAGIDHLSPSGAATLVDCERRYWWSYKRGLGRDERSEPMAMGSGFAAALEFSSLGAGLLQYEASRPLADGWTDPDLWQREVWIAYATIAAAYDGYLVRWPDLDVQREQTYLATLPGLDRVLQVRVDGLVKGSHLIEDKLRSASSMRAEAIENEVRQGRQLTAEIYAHWRVSGEILPVKFRIIKKCDPRKLKKAESQAEVESVVGEHFASDGVFNEFTVERTEAQLLEFRDEFAALAGRADGILDMNVPEGARNEKACHAYGRTCPALNHCQGWTSEANLLDFERNA